MFATFVFTLNAMILSAMIFMTVNAVRTIFDEWEMIRLLSKEYHVAGSWVMIVSASLSIIILWIYN